MVYSSWALNVMRIYGFNQCWRAILESYQQATGIRKDGSFVYCSRLAGSFSCLQTHMVASTKCVEVTAILHIQSSLAEMKAGALVSQYSCVGKAKGNFAAFFSIKEKKSSVSPPVLNPDTLLQMNSFPIQHTPSYLKFLNASNTPYCAALNTN